MGNDRDGVRVVSAGTIGNSIRGNSIHSNGLLGIDLGGDGVTLNDKKDPDTGPNELQNYPDLKSVSIEGTGTRVRGTLRSLPRTPFTIDFYASAAADPSSYSEGQRWLGSIVVTTNPGGVANFNELLRESSSPGEFITATATEQPAGNTSEFSAAVQLVGGAARARAARSTSPRTAGAGPFDGPRLRSASNSLELAPVSERASGFAVKNDAIVRTVTRDRPTGPRDYDVRDIAIALGLGTPSAVAHAASPLLDWLSDDELVELIPAASRGW